MKENLLITFSQKLTAGTNGRDDPIEDFCRGNNDLHEQLFNASLLSENPTGRNSPKLNR